MVKSGQIILLIIDADVETDNWLYGQKLTIGNHINYGRFSSDLAFLLAKYILLRISNFQKNPQGF